MMEIKGQVFTLKVQTDGEGQQVSYRGARGRAVSICSMAVLICGRPENNKSGAKCGAKANSLPGPQTKFNAMSKKDISKKKYLKW